MSINKPWKILLIDDDEDDYLITREILSESKTRGRKIELVWASSYQEGLRQLTQAGLYDAVLVDYDLDENNGLNLIREATRQAYSAPFILLTDRGNYNIDLEAMQAGASFYLTKLETTAYLLERSIRYAIAHKQTELALRQSQERGRRLLESAPLSANLLLEHTSAGLALLDAVPPYRILACNSVFQGLWPSPYSEQDLTGQDLLTLADAAHLSDTEAKFHLAAAARQALDAYPIVNGGAPSQPGQAWRIAPLPDEDGAVAHFVLTITRGEPSLQRPDWAWRENPNPILQLDRAGSLLFANPAGQDGLCDQSDRLRQEVASLLQDWARQALQQNKVLETELNCGNTIYFCQVVPVVEQGHVYIFANDISRFRQLADAMPQLVWTARPDGLVDYYNRRAFEYGGISPRPDGIWDWGPVLHPEDLEHTVQAWNHAVDTGDIYVAEHRVQMEDGSYRWHLSRGIPARDSAGNILRWFGTATDIHQQKLDQEMLRLREAELAGMVHKVSQSNQDLEQFAYIVSHDLQEPLRKIIAFGSRLQVLHKTDLDEESQDYLARMIAAPKRMQKMITDLLNYSRVSTSQQEFGLVNLTQTVRDVLADLEIRIRDSRAAITVDDLGSIEADPLQMHQLFQNLIGNALKFVSPGVAPVVHISSEVREGMSASRRVVRIQDNGIGFDEKHLDRIFGPFQRLHGKEAYEGSGIGLSICRKIAERHGGEISANSAPGEGTVFWVSLPVRQTGAR